MDSEAGERTRLYARHLASGARMTRFAGWELPLHYTAGPTAEHLAVRTAAGVFDIDHMGQFRLAGAKTEAFLNHVTTVDVRRIPLWGAHYGLLPYADGGLVDDIFLYRLDDAWWMIVNAANRAKDGRWLRAQAGGFQVEITDISDETYMLALQGPRARALLQTLTTHDLTTVPFHTCTRAEVAGITTLIGATGYTGEYGYELYFPPENAVAMWDALLAAGALPCGLAARDSLRLEACLPLYGHEISATIDPYTARLGMFVHLDKGPFIGRDALLKIALEGPERKIVGFEMQEKAVPRAGYAVQAEGRTVGVVTTGLKSPSTDRFIGLALVPTALSTPGTPLEIVVRKVPKQAVVVRCPFITPAHRRKNEG